MPVGPMHGCARAAAAHVRTQPVAELSCTRSRHVMQAASLARRQRRAHALRARPAHAKDGRIDSRWVVRPREPGRIIRLAIPRSRQRLSD